MSDRPLRYTFANHFHFVDMEWLWGYDVLAESLADMLTFCDATGARGNLNFDAVGYEHLASEHPDAIDALRGAVARGQIEVVGATYGQPYALFHHGESAIRQLTYGVRTTARLTSRRPITFWEEEFYFFPQLPQLLHGAGYQYASLFFQWTWHTPTVPFEDAPAIWWGGIDGTSILTAPRSSLNLHQWPEDFAALATDELLTSSPAPLVLQWLELLPSPDWMCRSELLLNGMSDLAALSPGGLRHGTLSEHLAELAPFAVPRRYTMDDVFHGASLGKNGDHGHRSSRRVEERLLAAEQLSVALAQFGRPYPQWSVYPLWQLEEAWRGLLIFQHHDNDECEGLCGDIGFADLTRADQLIESVLDRGYTHLARRCHTPACDTGDAEDHLLIHNPLAWSWTAPAASPDGTTSIVELPAAGWLTIPVSQLAAPTPVTCTEEGDLLVLRRGSFWAMVDRQHGIVTALGDGRITVNGPLWDVAVGDGNPNWVEPPVVHAEHEAVIIERTFVSGERLTITATIAPELDALDIHVASTELPELAAGWAGALAVRLDPEIGGRRGDALALRHDTPYAIGSIAATSNHVRKYPTGDWMTSEQYYEPIPRPFTSLSLLDFGTENAGTTGPGLLVLHDGSQGMDRAGGDVRIVMSMNDPWDGDYFRRDLTARFRAIPHHGLTDTRRWQLARQFTAPVHTRLVNAALPTASLLSTHGAGTATAIWREGTFDNDFHNHVSAHTEFPVLVRVVDFDGRGGPTRLSCGFPVARSWRTDLLGAINEEIPVEGQHVEINLRPHEIATIALDVPSLAVETRTLDDYRQVWATTHRIDDGLPEPPTDPPRPPKEGHE